MAGWSTIEIDGRPADVFEPEQAGTRDAALLFLHGHSERTIRENAAFTEPLQRLGMLTVCPHGGRCWWLDVVCPEFDAEQTPLAWLREAVVPWIGRRWGVERPRIGVCGNSMGGQGALQLAYRHPREFPVVAAISPAVDFHDWFGRGLPLDGMFRSAEQARQQTATLQIHPLNWPRRQLFVCDPADADWYEGCERLASKLSSMGIPYECDLETSAGGHSWEYFNSQADRVLDFVANSLRSLG